MCRLFIYFNEWSSADSCVSQRVMAKTETIEISNHPINLWTAAGSGGQEHGNRTPETRHCTDIYQILFSPGCKAPLRDNNYWAHNHFSQRVIRLGFQSEKGNVLVFLVIIRLSKEAAFLVGISHVFLWTCSKLEHWCYSPWARYVLHPQVALNNLILIRMTIERVCRMYLFLFSGYFD